MSENRAAYAANLPEAYDQRRAGHGIRIDPVPTMGFRLDLTIRALEWCWSSQGDTVPRTLLDVGAGVGNVGQRGMHHVERGDIGGFTYHAIEQTDAMAAHIQRRVPTATVGLWRFDPNGKGLRETLEQSSNVFEQHYAVALVSHVLEHVEDQYAFLDHVVDMIRPGGFLLVCAAKRAPQRVHFREYDLDKLAAVVSEYGSWYVPLQVWQTDYWADYLLAVQKPILERG